jgi:hypothetical protein
MPLVVRRSLKLCSGPVIRVHGIVRLRLFKYKQLKHKTLFLIAPNSAFRPNTLSEDPIIRIPCFESQGKYYNRVYCHVMCRRGTL